MDIREVWGYKMLYIMSSTDSNLRRSSLIHLLSLSIRRYLGLSISPVVRIHFHQLNALLHEDGWRKAISLEIVVLFSCSSTQFRELNYERDIIFFRVNPALNFFKGGFEFCLLGLAYCVSLSLQKDHLWISSDVWPSIQLSWFLFVENILIFSLSWFLCVLVTIVDENREAEESVRCDS